MESWRLQKVNTNVVLETHCNFIALFVHSRQVVNFVAESILGSFQEKFLRKDIFQPSMGCGASKTPCAPCPGKKKTPFLTSFPQSICFHETHSKACAMVIWRAFDNFFMFLWSMVQHILNLNYEYWEILSNLSNLNSLGINKQKIIKRRNFLGQKYFFLSTNCAVHQLVQFRVSFYFYLFFHLLSLPVFCLHSLAFLQVPQTLYPFLFQIAVVRVD